MGGFFPYKLSGGTEVMDFKTIRMIDQYETNKLNMLNLFTKE